MSSVLYRACFQFKRISLIVVKANKSFNSSMKAVNAGKT